MCTSIRIVDLDYYMQAPIPDLDVTYSEFRGSSIYQVPVLRVFGTTTSGEKICSHIHGVFPYLYIPYNGGENPNSTMYQIATSIDKAINISMGQGTSTTQHIYKITLVSGIPMYGYHSKKHQFLKIYLYNPIFIRKVSNLLQNENLLMGKIYQPHETHLNFTLQFMIDFNLHGMSFLNVSTIQFRSNERIKKVSSCKLEGDILAEDILNRQEVEGGNFGANPGIAAIWNDERQRRRNNNKSSQMSQFLSLENTNVPPTSSHSLFQRALLDRLAVFSQDKDKHDLNNSVYPAECSNRKIMNASFLDVNTPGSTQSSNVSSYDDLDVTAQDLDSTLIGNISLLDETLDAEAKQFLEVLHDLRAQGREIEEDSILSQLPQTVDEEPDDLDLSISLAEATNIDITSTNSNLERNSQILNINSNKQPKSPTLKNDLKSSNAVIIPQLDGPCDSSYLEVSNKPLKHSSSNNNRNELDLVKTPKKKRSTSNSFTEENYFEVYGIPKIYSTQEDAIQECVDNIEQPCCAGEDITTFCRHCYVCAKLDRTVEYRPKKWTPERTKRKTPRKVVKKSARQDTQLEKSVETGKRRRGRPRKNPAKDSIEFNEFTPEEIECMTPRTKEKHLYVKITPLTPEDFQSCKSFPKQLPDMPDINYSDFSDFEEYWRKEKLRKGKKIIRKLNFRREVQKELFPMKEKVSRKRAVYKKRPLKIPEKHREKVDKLCKRQEISLSLLESGLPPVFKVRPAKSYKFRKGELQNIPSFNISFEPSQKSTDNFNWPFKITPGVQNDKVMHLSISVPPPNTIPEETSHSYPLLSPKACDFDWEQIAKDQKENERKLFSSSFYSNNYMRRDLKSISRLLFVDGADDASSDEEPSAIKRRKVDGSLKYGALPVTVSSPRSGAASPARGFHILSTPRSKNKDKCNGRLTPKSKTCDNSINKIKRNIKFLNEPQVMEETVVEEHISCTDNILTLRRKERLVNISSLSLEKQAIQNKFSALTKSESYDLINCINPMEGSSKMNIVPDVDPEIEKSDNEESENFTNFDSLEDYFKSQKNALKSSKKTESLSFNSTNIQNQSQCDTSDEKSPENVQTQPDELLNIQLQITSLPENDLNFQYITLTPKIKTPTYQDVFDSLQVHDIPEVRHVEPFYSNVDDVTGNVEVGYSVLKIRSKTTFDVPDFGSSLDGLSSYRNNYLKQTGIAKGNPLAFCKTDDVILRPAVDPPSQRSVLKWLEEKVVPKPVEKEPEKPKIYLKADDGSDEDNLDLSLTLLSPATPSTQSSKSSQTLSPFNLHSDESNDVFQKEPSPTITRSKSHKKRRRKCDTLEKSTLRRSLLFKEITPSDISGQIAGTSLNNTYGFKSSLRNMQDARALIEHQYLTTLVMEVHTKTRGDFKPNPEQDELRAIFYSISNDVPPSLEVDTPINQRGVVVVNMTDFQTSGDILRGTGIGSSCAVTYVATETELIQTFTTMLKRWDPDILVGYEIQLQSWGYLVERAQKLSINLPPLISRVQDKNFKNYDTEYSNELNITGRIVLDFWRLLKHEISLQSYTFENICYQILHERIPTYSYKDLSFWWEHPTSLYRHRTVEFYLTRVDGVLRIIDQLDLIGRTSELARLFGIQFYEVLSRGSQFRVESMMLRLAKPQNYIPVSPSVQQRAKMRAPEYIALVLEPESKLYVDPVIVLDFQSLYPSIMIAYNYCFTTCLGRVEHLGRNSAFEFGATQLKVSRQRVKHLCRSDLLNYSPCGVAYVKKQVRDGILPRMLREILDTRLMVKQSMKENKNDSVLKRVLHNRQLGLKLIANVTYGYTSANFSGRMPSVEVADSVVSKGRETLQRTIGLVDETKEWGAKVVYGDTDSIFVVVPGKTREQAFEVGRKIADAVTNANPDPMKLKLEKVYQPCILQTKKRYVGYMYEGPDQKKPVYEAKGIETVRRDGCPAVAKMLEKCLRLLFEKKDVSIIKTYVLRQFNKILAGRLSIQDLTFAKEYRGASGYRPGACVPALELTKKWTATDKRNEPRSGERVPYVIINGPPGLPLIKLVRSPRELLHDSGLRPNALYYITRVIIPPINRCFSLIGADLHQWFNQMPRKQYQYLPVVSPSKKSTISQYFMSTICASCGVQTQSGLCEKCSSKPQETGVILYEKVQQWEHNYNNINLICHSCTKIPVEYKCASLDCPALYRYYQTKKDLQQVDYVRQILANQELF